MNVSVRLDGCRASYAFLEFGAIAAFMTRENHDVPVSIANGRVMAA